MEAVFPALLGVCKQYQIIIVLNTGPVSITQLAGLRLCLEALATTGTIPDAELFRLHDRISMLGVLQSLDKSIQKVPFAIALASYLVSQVYTCAILAVAKLAQM